MIKIIPRKRKIHPQLISIHRIDDDNADNIQKFEEKYGEYKNFYGKITAYEYVCQSPQIHKVTTKEEVKNFTLQKINEIQKEAKELNISSKIYHYLSDDVINKIIKYIDEAKNLADAINYLYQICLKNNGG